MKKIILYIAVSKDGFIADEQGSVDFLPQPNEELAKDYNQFIDRVDTIVFGRTTYEQIKHWDIEWPHKGLNTYIFSSRTLDDENVQRISGDVKQNLLILQKQVGKDIFLMGGANLISQVAKLDLIDEYVIFTVSNKLTKGIKLFDGITNPLLTKKLVSKVNVAGIEKSIYLKQ